jgi:hypothetical protein
VGQGAEKVEAIPIELHELILGRENHNGLARSPDKNGFHFEDLLVGRKPIGMRESDVEPILIVMHLQFDNDKEGGDSSIPPLADERRENLRPRKGKQSDFGRRFHLSQHWQILALPP